MRVAYVVWYSTGGRYGHAVKTFLPGKMARRRAISFARVHAGSTGACVRSVPRSGKVKTAACFLPGGRRAKRNVIPKMWKGR